MKTLTYTLAVILALALLTGCSPNLATPGTTPTPLTEPTRAEIPTRTPEPSPAPTNEPAQKNEPAPTMQITPTEVPQPYQRDIPLELPPGLVVEEYPLEGPPDMEPLTFIPLQASQAAILARHTSEREAFFPDNSFFTSGHFAMRVDFGAGELVAGADELFAIENFDQDGREGWASVERNGEEIYRIDVGPGSPIPTLRGLWAYGDHWLLETARITRREEGNMIYSDAIGQVSQDGELLNSLLGYEEMFGLQLMAGKPFYFFKQDGLIHLAYDGQVVETGYDEIPHYGCCSAGALNPRRAANMVAFFASRDGVWYYVETGVFE